MGDFLLKTKGKQSIAYPVRMIDSPSALSVLSNELAWRIYREMSEPSCPMDIAKRLGIHEQKVYYYINRFRKARMIREVSSEQRHGTIARFYQAKDSLFAVSAGSLQNGKDVSISSPSGMSLLEPFIKDNKLNARIIVGSPDPHGPWKARGSDSFCAIDLALFLGSFTGGVDIPNYRLDVETRESDLRENLILIGGPAVNMVTRRMNSRLPVRLELRGERSIKSTLSGKAYRSDDCGIIVLTDNPWDRKKKILLIAGKRFQGTRAAVISLIKDLEKVMQGNRNNRKYVARVVRGYDMDGDGVIDASELLE
jgi:hypothetical protein